MRVINEEQKHILLFDTIYFEFIKFTISAVKNMLFKLSIILLARVGFFEENMDGWLVMAISNLNFEMRS